MLYHTEELNLIKEELVKRKNTLSVAESVTSGHLQAAFSSATEAAKFFQGGLTAYNAGQKCRHLNVEPIHALETNCISEDVTKAMAIQVGKLFLSDFGIGITGYASTVPELGVHHMFAYFAIAFRGKIINSKKITTSKTESIDVQLDYTNQVIDAFVQCLSKLPITVDGPGFATKTS